MRLLEKKASLLPRREKNQAAVKLGKISGKARAESLTSEQRSE
jgi:hypothetical protein